MLNHRVGKKSYLMNKHICDPHLGSGYLSVWIPESGGAKGHPIPASNRQLLHRFEGVRLGVISSGGDSR